MRIRGYAPATPCWSELACPDPSAAASFYSGLFGWEAAPTPSGLTEFRLGGLAVAGLVPAPPGAPAGWLPYMSTEDVEATVAAVAAAGGSFLTPVTDLADRGRMAHLRDPEGAVFGLWQRGTFRGAQVASEPGAVCWNDNATRDVTAAVGFYGKVFGWTDQKGGLVTGFEYWEWMVSGRVVAGMTPMGREFPPEVPAHWRTTVEVADCAAAVRRCTDLGGQVLIGPLDVQVGHYAQLLDPQGAPLGIISLVPELQLTPEEAWLSRSA